MVARAGSALGPVPGHPGPCPDPVHLRTTIQTETENGVCAVDVSVSSSLSQFSFGQSDRVIDQRPLMGGSVKGLFDQRFGAR